MAVARGVAVASKPAEDPPRVRRRDLRGIPPRSATDSESLARVSADDVAHAHETAARVCTPGYRRYLAAALDERDLSGG